MKPETKPFDVAAWAKQNSRAYGGTRCTLCVAPKEVNEALMTIIGMRRKKQSTVAQVQVCRMLAEKFNLRCGATTLSRHISEHLREKW
jgi:hypothetical protein